MAAEQPASQADREQMIARLVAEPELGNEISAVALYALFEVEEAS